MRYVDLLHKKYGLTPVYAPDDTHAFTSSIQIECEEWLTDTQRTAVRKALLSDRLLAILEEADAKE